MSRRILVLAILLLAALCLAAALAAGGVYAIRRRQATQERPLVLIHAPLNRDRVSLGGDVMVHATAREADGVAQAELWVDGVLVTTRESPAGGPVTPLVLTGAWRPATLGPHVIVVRATSAGGVQGQATVAVEVVEAEEHEGPDLVAHLVQDDGETLDAIAAEYGASTGELESLNPGLADDLEPGDAVLVPGPDPSPGGGAPPPPGEPAGEGEEEPAGDEAPPDPDPDPPGSLLEVMELVGLEGVFGLPAEPVSLRVEATGLETHGEFGSVHCYVSIAGSEPRWVPDADLDQATDEYFSPTGDGGWNVADYLAGERGTIVPWASDEPLRIDVSCVGVPAGADDAVGLGRLGVTARPEAWDGVVRRGVGASDEGSFTLDYRIGPMTGTPRGHPIFLDPTMTPPTGLWLDSSHYALRWNYFSRADEEEIDGFRIYLNDTFQWTEPPDARQSGLPPEWFSPPCGERYRFTVSAFRYGYPDGPESPLSNEVTTFTGEPGDPGCERSAIVTFHALTTEYLERDMGSMVGFFYANEEQLHFDGRCEGAGICGTVGLYADHEYDLAATMSYLTGSTPRFLVDLPPDEVLYFGFEITTEDEGLACAGEVWYPSNDVDSPRRGTVTSERPSGYSNRCIASYTIELLGGAPVVEPGEEPPLPLLMVENLTVDEATDRLRIHVRNTGAASWPAHDLDAALFWPSGEGIGAFTWPDLYVEPGREAILEYPEPIPGPPLGVCVLLDPGNEVPEEDDRSIGWTRGRTCRPLPDLTVTGAAYGSEEERLFVMVENVGDGSVEHRDLNVRLDMADGAYFVAPAEWWSDVSIPPRGTVALEWPGIGVEQRARMLEGYTATIDPYNDIAEEDGFNNEYTVRPATRLWLSWVWIDVPYDFRDSAEFSFNAYVVSGPWSRRVASWHAGPDIDWGSCFRPYHCIRHYDDEEYDSYWFDVGGEESLEVVITLGDRSAFRADVTARATYGPDDDWGAGAIGPRRTCGYLGGTSGPGTHTWILDYYGRYTWDTTFHVCLEDAE